MLLQIDGKVLSADAGRSRHLMRLLNHGHPGGSRRDLGSVKYGGLFHHRQRIFLLLLPSLLVFIEVRHHFQVLLQQVSVPTIEYDPCQFLHHLLVFLVDCIGD